MKKSVMMLKIFTFTINQTTPHSIKLLVKLYSKINSIVSSVEVF